jgi:hypothetical protein
MQPYCHCLILNTPVTPIISQMNQVVGIALLTNILNVVASILILHSGYPEILRGFTHPVLYITSKAATVTSYHVLFCTSFTNKPLIRSQYLIACTLQISSVVVMSLLSCVISTMPRALILFRILGLFD